jgi:lipid-binding SYLF domain-containing protein
MTTYKTRRTLAAALAVSVAFSLGAAGTVWAEEDADAAVKDATKDARQSLELFKKADRGMDRALSDAAGYAIFPAVAKGALAVGGAAGDGVLFEKGKPVGKVRMTQLTIGPQLGSQTYSELILFEDEANLTKFKRGNFAFSAQASAVAVRDGAAATAPYERGVRVYSVAKSGMMFEASIGGQKFSFVPYAKEKVGALLW